MVHNPKMKNASPRMRGAHIFWLVNMQVAAAVFPLFEGFSFSLFFLLVLTFFFVPMLITCNLLSNPPVQAFLIV